MHQMPSPTKYCFLWVNGSCRIRDNHCRTSGLLATESYWRLAFGIVQTDILNAVLALGVWIEIVDTGDDENYAVDAFFVGDGKSAFGTVLEFSPQVILFRH